MLTAEQQASRLNGLGASDIAAAMGLDPYRTPFDLWAEKTGLVKPFTGNEYTEWGNRLEPVLIAAYADRHGVVVEPNAKTCQHPEHDWMFCTPDARVFGTDLRTVPLRGLEAKNRNVRMAQQWGEPGTDEVPEAVALQCHWSMAVTGLPEWDVAVLLGGYDFRTYRLYANPAIADSTVELAKEFWFGRVRTGKAPDAVAADNETIGRILRQSSDMLKPTDEAIDELLQQLRDVRQQYKQTEEQKDAIEAVIKAFIGDAAGLDSSVAKCTWKTAKPSVSTDWEGAARQALLQLSVLIPSIANYDERLHHQAQAANIVESFTGSRPGSRRFLFTPKGA